MSTPDTPDRSGVTGAAQDVGNRLVEDAQELVNEVVDVGEAGLDTLLGAVSKTIHLLADAVDGIRSRTTGGGDTPS